ANQVPGVFHESITIHRTGLLDVKVLERSFAEIIRRHEAWRTTFEVTQDQAEQIIHPAPSCFALPVADLRSLPEKERETEGLRLATQDAREPFDLHRGPLVR